MYHQLALNQIPTLLSGLAFVWASSHLRRQRSQNNFEDSRCSRISAPSALRLAVPTPLRRSDLSTAELKFDLIRDPK